MGTVIRPLSGDEDYDLDVVCEFSKSKSSQTQKKLFDDLGYELKLYADAYGMETPDPWRRCWTLQYADEAQFHMDILPCVPDAQDARRLREIAKVAQDFVEKSVSITDKEDPSYLRISNEWPVSNPNGYADWFYARMKTAFEAKRRRLMLLEKRADISQIPEFRVKTPLQAAIQILKHHRDRRFAEEPEYKPTSIVIITLAAMAYAEEATITGALFSILAGMDKYIEQRGEEYWIVNPSDPRENFADFWKSEPDRKDAFYDWLEVARTDFRNAAEQTDADGFIDALAPRMGRDLVEKAAHREKSGMVKESLVRRATSALQKVLDAPHRKPVVWPKVQFGSVHLAGIAERLGFRTVTLQNNGQAISKGYTLTFSAQTDVAPPYKVYWQVVNTGSDARAARNLRGRFEEVTVEQGKLTKTESSRYWGVHSIECFIVKGGYCVAWSGPFLVNIS